MPGPCPGVIGLGCSGIPSSTLGLAGSSHGHGIWGSSDTTSCSSQDVPAPGLLGIAQGGSRPPALSHEPRGGNPTASWKKPEWIVGTWCSGTFCSPALSRLFALSHKQVSLGLGSCPGTGPSSPTLLGPPSLGQGLDYLFLTPVEAHAGSRRP